MGGYRSGYCETHGCFSCPECYIAESTRQREALLADLPRLQEIDQAALAWRDVHAAWEAGVKTVRDVIAAEYALRKTLPKAGG